MSVSKPWKDQERRHAKRMPGGVRLWRPDFGESLPDGESPTDTWDSKRLAAMRIVTLFWECRAKYKDFTGRRRFHLVVNSSNSRRPDLVVVQADEYARLVEIEMSVQKER
jgi:hypothetical protein